MTRINLIDPVDLTDNHLIAEYREIRLLTSHLVRSLQSSRGVVKSTLPNQFTLNSGHVRFFYDKGKYLHHRYDSLKKEMIARGFSPENEFEREKWPDRLYGDWTPTERDKNIVRERIILRINQKPHLYRYQGKYIQGSDFVKNKYQAFLEVKK